MNERERKRYEREQAKKALFEDDLKAEEMLKEQINLTKRAVATSKQNGQLIYERVKGFFTSEHDQT